MSGQWIKSPVGLLTDPRFSHLLELLGEDMPEAQASGHLHFLWFRVAEVQPDGDLHEWRDYAIARAAGWKGDPARFVAALRESGWLTADNHVADWDFLKGRGKPPSERERERAERRARGYEAVEHGPDGKFVGRVEP